MMRAGCISLVALSVAISAPAVADELTLTFPRGPVVIPPGGFGTVAVALSNAESRQGAHLALEFDASKLHFTSIAPTGRIAPPLQLHQGLSNNVVHFLVVDETAARSGVTAGNGSIALVTFQVPTNAPSGVHLQRDNVTLIGAILADSALAAVPIDKVNYVGLVMTEYLLDDPTATTQGDGRVIVEWTCQRNGTPGVAEGAAVDRVLELYRCVATTPPQRMLLAAYDDPPERLTYIDNPPSGDGSETMAGGVFYTLAIADGATGVELDLSIVSPGGPVPLPEVIREYALFGATPNPFARTAVISYQVPRRDHVSLKVYNVAGQLVKTLVNEIVEPNRYAVSWDGVNEKGSAVSSGVYFYRFVATGHVDTKKVVFLR